MGHEITKTDAVVLKDESAWHGLGMVIDQALTPREAAKIVFPWTVIQKPLTYKFNDRTVVVDAAKINVRSDNGAQLGLVGDNYQVVQPFEIADFCEAIAKEDEKVTIETAGSIRGGKRIWYLCKTEAFEIGDAGDAIVPYLAVSNGFDGGSSLRITPTTIRVVCSNTLHMVIPTDEKTLKESAFVLRHTSNLKDRIADVKQALKTYAKTTEGMKKVMSAMSKVEVNQADLEKFFFDCYQVAIDPIPENPVTKVDMNKRARAMSAFQSFSKRFDDESTVAGTSAWNMFNAFSGLVQHDRKARGTDDTDRVEKKAADNLFGLAQKRTQTALRMAWKMAVV